MVTPEADDALVKAIQDSVAVTVIEVDGIKYTDKQVYLPPAEPVARAIKLSTLDSLADFIAADVDGLSLTAPDARHLVHVAGPAEVRLLGPLDGRHRQREELVRVVPLCVAGTQFDFGHFYGLDEFVTKLQALFLDTDERARLLRIVGNIKQEKVKTSSDDGVTQTVVAKAGVVNVAEVAVPNPVTLAPYRTFPEVKQPESEFILRLRAGRTEDDLPTAALFEGDGGAWQLKAVERVRDYLKSKVEFVTVIA